MKVKIFSDRLIDPLEKSINSFLETLQADVVFVEHRTTIVDKHVDGSSNILFTAMVVYEPKLPSGGGFGSATANNEGGVSGNA